MTHLRVNSFWTVLRAFSPRGPNRFRFRHTKGKASEVNVRRSLGELQAKLEKRTAERDEALAREAGAAEVLQIINASAGNFAPVLEVILEKALALCAASLGDLSTYDGERFLAVTTRGFPPTLVNFYRDPFTPGPRSYFGR